MSPSLGGGVWVLSSTHHSPLNFLKEERREGGREMRREVRSVKGRGIEGGRWGGKETKRGKGRRREG
jgi:hypothetical protein